MTPVLLSEAVVQLVGLLKAGMVFVSLHIDPTPGLELEAMVVLELVHLVASEVVQVAMEVVVLVEPLVADQVVLDPVVVLVSFLSNLILLQTESSSPVDMRPVLLLVALMALMLLSTISVMLLAGIGLSPAAAILSSFLLCSQYESS